MLKLTFVSLMFCGAVMSAAPSAFGQAPDSATRIAAQREAMKSLAFMDGVWRGPASTVLPSGEKKALTQTERIGSFLDGTVKVIEGCGYEADGKVAFNALGIISYDASTKKYMLHSYAMGYAGDFEVKLTPDGYTWDMPAGPMTIRQTAVIKDGTWKQIGQRVVPGQEPIQYLEMNLTRIGDTDWPSAGGVPAK
jgi:hypothetical protein